MKTAILTLACLLIAPMAFAEAPAQHENQTATTIEQPITVTGAAVITNEGGLAASYQPFRTLIVRKDTPGRYVLNGPGHILNTKGEVVRTAIRPGTRVHVFYTGTGTLRTLDHVVVD
jgi:hypothetical protein